MNPKYSKPSACVTCVLETAGLGYVPVMGPASAKLVFIAEAPAKEEIASGEPLVGSAGAVHARVLHRAQIDRSYTRAHNVLSCMVPGGVVTTASYIATAISHCRQYLDPTLSAVPRDGVVVTYGGVALDHVLNLGGVEGVAVKDFHGTVNRSPDDRYWVVPTFHPSHLLRGAMNLLEVVTHDVMRAHGISQHGFTRSASTLVVDPDPEWFRLWVADHLQRTAADPDGVGLSLDTEFPESIAGQDESELTVGAASPLLRVNGANDGTTGWTVPYRAPYIGLVEQLLAGVAALHGIVWTWNKYADWEQLQRAGHTLTGIECYDAMQAWHYLQSDLPKGLGFVAPFASDHPPWKHWAKQRDREGPYAAADGLQTWRTCMWILKSLITAGMWEVFVRDWHERDQYVLRPSHEMGVPVDRAALEAFHQELQTKHVRLLEDIKTTSAQGLLKPKAGYAKRPKGKDGADPLPPTSILGAKHAKRKSEAKQAYTREQAVLVERVVEAEIRICTACGQKGVTAAHRCKRTSARSARRKSDANTLVLGQSTGGAENPARRSVPVDSALGQQNRSVASVSRSSRSPNGGVPDTGGTYLERCCVTRWFWQLPFNPDSWQQLLGYISAQGHEAGQSRKTRKPTTDAQSLKRLAAETGDQLYQLILDYRAVQKVDSTYALGCLSRLDADDRLHPEVLPIPSTLRDSSRDPNLQNVISDRSGPTGLASGFRKTIAARDGIPTQITPEEVQQWEARWGT